MTGNHFVQQILIKLHWQLTRVLLNTVMFTNIMFDICEKQHVLTLNNSIQFAPYKNEIMYTFWLPTYPEWAKIPDGM